jgi:hypothetical protein
VKLGVCGSAFCVQDHTETDLRFQPGHQGRRGAGAQFRPRNGPIPIILVLIKPTLNP